MNSNEFSIPLRQSIGLVAFFVLLLLCVPTHQAAEMQTAASLSPGLMFIKALFLPFALSIALSVAIAVLFGIFLIAVSLHSPDQAITMFHSLKSNLSALIDETVQCIKYASSKKCCSGCCSSQS